MVSTKQKASEELLAEYKQENERLRQKLAEKVVPVRDEVVYYCALWASLITLIALLIMAVFYGN